MQRICQISFRGDAPERRGRKIAVAVRSSGRSERGEHHLRASDCPPREPPPLAASGGADELPPPA